MSRYRLLCEGVLVAEGDNALDLVEDWWATIKTKWQGGWVLEDTEPKPNQWAAVWTVCWTAAYNGVELSPLVGTR